MMVTARFGATSFSVGSPSTPVVSIPTFTSAKDGMNLDTGSCNASFPASISIMAATLVIGLVIEWSAKIVSGVIESPVATSRTPKHFR